MLLRNSKVKYETIFYWTSSLASPSSLLKAPIVAVTKAAHIGAFKAICKAGRHVDSLHDLAQKQDRNSKELYLMDKLQYSSTHPWPTSEET